MDRDLYGSLLSLQTHTAYSEPTLLKNQWKRKNLKNLAGISMKDNYKLPT